MGAARWMPGSILRGPRAGSGLPRCWTPSLVGPAADLGRSEVGWFQLHWGTRVVALGEMGWHCTGMAVQRVLSPT